MDLTDRHEAESVRGSMASLASDGKSGGTSSSRKLPGHTVVLVEGARNSWQHLTAWYLDGVLQDP